MDAATWVRQARRSAGRSQRELAEWTRLPQPTIARIERGQQIPRVDTFVRLMTAAGFSIRIEPTNPDGGVDRGQIERWIALPTSERVRRSIAFGHAARRLRGARVAASPRRRHVLVPDWDEPAADDQARFGRR
jgi:transcriptional regulator with XRE-family HTH domain